jgi:hypothetical protein
MEVKKSFLLETGIPANASTPATTLPPDRKSSGNTPTGIYGAKSKLLGDIDFNSTQLPIGYDAYRKLKSDVFSRGDTEMSNAFAGIDWLMDHKKYREAIAIFSILKALNFETPKK